MAGWILFAASVKSPSQHFGVELEGRWVLRNSNTPLVAFRESSELWDNAINLHPNVPLRHNPRIVRILYHLLVFACRLQTDSPPACRMARIQAGSSLDGIVRVVLEHLPTRRAPP